MSKKRVLGGRFEVGDILGQGGMGTVYHGVDLQTGEHVAIKSLKPDLLADDPGLVERFAREGEALRKLNHPNIVKMLAAVQDSGDHFLVMEYVSGGSLHQWLTQQPQPAIDRVTSIALDLSDALTRAHRLNIIHRDLKPANVLLADDGTPRLTDFGVAQVGSQKHITQTGAAVGTLHYLSPEALKGELVDPRSDIWAFGVLLFELLAGKHPFHADNFAGIITAILMQPLPDLEALRPDAPVALVDLVYRMLEKDRQQRIPSVRLVGAELEAILQGRDTASPVGTQRAVSGSSFDTPTPPNDLLAESEKIPDNLPVQTTPFVGREHELAELAKLLDHPTTRLVTILAPGGMGKTRLALETAQTLLNRGTVGALHPTPSSTSPYVNGVYFVALAPLTSPDFIIPTIADAVGFQFYPGGEPKQQLLDYFHEKSMLLVIDNWEHMLDGAGIVGNILGAAPGVKILATSRERLNLSGETLYALSGMDFPDWETPEDALNYAAVKLFMQSARRIRPDFELVGDDLTYLARICRLVAGMPLGIVLAAAWVEMLSLKEIATEIETSLDFLETELRDVPERQRSLRGVFEYSWNRLSDDERSVFKKLSVFRGGFTREAAQAVASTSLKTLASLVNKSLLRRDPDTGRYEIHELLRQYGGQQLSAEESDHSHDLHSAYFADFLEQRWTHLKDFRQKTATAEIENEIENIHVAWNTMVRLQKVMEIAQSASSLWLVLGDWHGRYQEAHDLFDAAIKSLRTKSGTVDTHNLIGHLIARQAWVVCYLGFPAHATTLAREAVVMIDQQTAPEYALLAYDCLALICLFENEVEEMRLVAQQGLKMAREITNSWMLERMLYWMGFCVYILGNLQEAKQLGEEGLKIAEQNSDFFTINVISTYLLSQLARDMGDYQKARKLLDQGLDYFTEIQLPWGIGLTYGNLGDLAFVQADYSGVKNYYKQRIKTFAEIGGVAEILRSILGLSKGIAFGEAKVQAVELLALVSHHPTTLQITQDECEKICLQLQAELPPDVYAAAVERGKARNLDATVRELLAE